MYTLKIKITKELLKESRYCQRKNDSCVFARAFRDFFPDAIVGYTVIYPFGIESHNTIPVDIENQIAFATTQDIDNYIRIFDSVHDVTLLREQEFELSIPDWVIEKINIDEIKPLLVNHKNLELISK